MNYPLISEYIEAIKAAEGNFEELTNLRPVLGDDEQPVMTSGNFAVVFKMQDIETGKLYALKCFTKEQEGRADAYHQIADALKDVDSPYLVSLRYLDSELFVDTDQTTETEFPVLLMDWVEGKTLDKYLRENLDDKYALEMLAYRFSQLAQWLIPQPFAHGDLKPDNILVREDGTLVLVDYDGMYVPAMKGQAARELGSPDFRHPLRTENDFDEHIDDFSVVTILLSLLIISRDSSYWNKYVVEDRFLFSYNDYVNIDKCKITTDLFTDAPIILNTFELLSTLCKRKNEFINDKLPTVTRPHNVTENHTYNEERLSIAQFLTEEELNSKFRTSFITIYDELAHGCKHFYDDITCVKEGCCQGDSHITKILFPRFLEIIEPFAFSSCSSLLLTNIEDTALTTIGEHAFSKCFNLGCVSLPYSLNYIGSYAFAGCGFKILTIPENVHQIDDCAFAGCFKMRQIRLPNSLEIVGKSIFKNCKSLEHIIIPGESKTKLCKLMPEYAHLFLVEGSLKYLYLLVKMQLINEKKYAYSYYNHIRPYLDRINEFNTK